MALRKVKLNQDRNYTPEQGVLDIIIGIFAETSDLLLQPVIDKNEEKLKWCLQELQQGKQPLTVEGFKAAAESVLEEAREALDSD